MSNKSPLTESATSSKSDNWRTPVDLVDRLRREFRIVVDLAASRDNRVVPGYLGLDHEIEAYRDALSCEWARVIASVAQLESGGLRPIAGFFNPPFSLLDEFIEKAGDEAEAGATTVAVLPARIEKRAWHEDLARRASDVRILQGRLKYWRYAEPGEVVGRGVDAWIAEGGELLADSALFASAVVIWRGGAPRFGARVVHWDWRNA